MWWLRVTSTFHEFWNNIIVILYTVIHTGCLTSKLNFWIGFFDLWCLGASGGSDICVSLTSFRKNDIGWPQQPLTERVSDISEILDIWQSIPQKGTGSGHLGARNDQTIRISKYFDEMRLSRSLRPLRPLIPLSSLRLQMCEGLKNHY